MPAVVAQMPLAAGIYVKRHRRVALVMLGNRRSQTIPLFFRCPLTPAFAEHVTRYLHYDCRRWINIKVVWCILLGAGKNQMQHAWCENTGLLSLSLHAENHEFSRARCESERFDL